MSKADERHDISVDEYIASIADETINKDALTLADIMHNITGCTPQLYGIGTVGFGVYKYKYSSGRQGEAHTLSFYPRKGKITIYLMDGTKRHGELLNMLGKHTTTGFCVYIKQLADIELDVLVKILENSYKNIQSMSSSGAVDHIMWQA